MLKIAYNKKKIQNLVINMPFMSSHKARKSICHDGVFSPSLDNIKWHNHSKHLNILNIWGRSGSVVECLLKTEGP